MTDTPKRNMARPAKRAHGRTGRSPEGRGKGAAPAYHHKTSPGQGWIWGLHAAEAALANPGRRVLRVAATLNAAQKLRLEPGSYEDLRPHEIDALLPAGAVHQGVALEATALKGLGLDELIARPGPIVVLDQVTDPQNVGAVFRLAAAFDAAGVVLQNRKAPALFGAVCKAAVGAADQVPHAEVVNIAEAIEAMKRAGRTVVGLAGEAELPLSAWRGELAGGALVMGAEDKGLRPKVADSCTGLARIPMSDRIESLNVATACAIALYEAFSARG